MKIALLAVVCCSGLLLAGCASSSCETCKSAPPAAATRSQVYDAATDTTIVRDGGYEWHLKGNLTNVVLNSESTK